LVLWGIKSKNFSVVFKSAMKNNRKITEKTGIFTQNLFLRKSIMVFGATFKQIAVGT